VQGVSSLLRWVEGCRPGAGVVILLPLIGALAALNWRLLAMTIDISPVEIDRGAGSRGIVDAAAVAPSELKPLSSFPQTGARPLFSPTRRPSAVAAQAPSPSPPDLRLIGVMTIAPDHRSALLRSTHEPRGRWISEGGQIGQWNVVTVGPSEVVIAGRGGRHELKLPRRGANRRANP
jgi:hypothetical protein